MLDRASCFVRNKIRPQFQPVSYMEVKCYLKAERSKNMKSTLLIKIQLVLSHSFLPCVLYSGFLLEKNLRGAKDNRPLCFQNNRLLFLLFFLLFFRKC